MMYDMELEIDLGSLAVKYRSHLALVCGGVTDGMRISRASAQSISWHSVSDREFMEHELLEGFRLAVRRLRAWCDRAVMGYPLSRITLRVDESFEGFDFMMRFALERFILLRALASKLCCHDKGVDAVMRSLIERHDREAGEELESVVAMMALCDNNK